ncbi:MAG: uridylate kinase [Gemmataceae bacterium]
MDNRPCVVKVGGSLFDWPDLGPVLTGWLKTLATPRLILLPGGGPVADVVRAYDRWHRLGEETSHWLALRGLTLQAYVLATLLPSARVVPDAASCAATWEQGALPILDGYEWFRRDEGQPGCLPHAWEVTSDALAARVAVLTKAYQLILLKSTDMPLGRDWRELGQVGFVDAHLARVLARSVDPPLRVRAVNLRSWEGPVSFG